MVAHYVDIRKQSNATNWIVLVPQSQTHQGAFLWMHRVGVFWREIDYLLALSRADNSPNVIHESKVAGVPIIGTNIGGIPELLNPSFDFVFENDLNLVKNVSQAIVKISKTQPKMPNQVGMRYRSTDSQGNIDGFLQLYSKFI